MAEEEAFLNMGEEVSEAAAAPPTGLGMDGNARVPTMEEILQLIESATGLSDEEKASIKEDVLKFNAEQEALLNPDLFPAAAAGGLFAPNTLLFIILVSLVALIIGFFVYKLIKTEKDKIKSKELKRIAKEQRRNKKKKA